MLPFVVVSFDFLCLIAFDFDFRLQCRIDIAIEARLLYQTIDRLFSIPFYKVEIPSVINK